VTKCRWETVPHDWPGHRESCRQISSSYVEQSSWCRSPCGSDTAPHPDHCCCRGVQNRSPSLGRESSLWNKNSTSVITRNSADSLTWISLGCQCERIHETQVFRGNGLKYVARRAFSNYRLSVSRLVSYQTHLIATDCHLPCGISQCYLSPDTSEHTPP